MALTTIPVPTVGDAAPARVRRRRPVTFAGLLKVAAAAGASLVALTPFYWMLRTAVSRRPHTLTTRRPESTWACTSTAPGPGLVRVTSAPGQR